MTLKVPVTPPPEDGSRPGARDPLRFGKYRVLRRIASGGMSEISLCLLPGEEGFRKRVAVKSVHPRHAEDARFRDLFIREARLSASLSHPNVIQVFDFGREGSAYFLAMEYVEGFDLAQAAAQARRLGLAVPHGVWRHWMEGILSGLKYLHEKGILHRDLSPGNILLGRTGAVKLADFGVSRAAAFVDAAGDVQAGKAAYFSPERARGEGATPQSDLFAAAVVAAELLLGRRLFEGSDPEGVLERVRRFDADALVFPESAGALAGILRKGLSGDPAKRFRSADEFLAALSRHGSGRATPAEIATFWAALFPEAEEEATVPALAPESAPVPSMVRETPPPYGARGWKTLAGASVAAAALAAGGIYLWVDRKNPAPVASNGPIVTPSPGSLPAPSPVPPETAASTPASTDYETGTRTRRAGVPSSRPAEGADVAAVPASAPAAQRFVRIETDPEGARILSGSGTPIGRTPARIDLAEIGGKGIVLSREGYESRRISAGALARVETFRMELEPVMGTVEAIQAIPWAKIYIDGRFLGDTPLNDVRLPVGEHRLRFVNEPLGVDKTEKLTIRPGSNTKVIVQMTGGGR